MKKYRNNFMFMYFVMIDDSLSFKQFEIRKSHKKKRNLRTNIGSATVTVETSRALHCRFRSSLFTVETLWT